MVTILPAKRPGFLQGLLEGGISAAPGALEKLVERKKENALEEKKKKLLNEENEAAKEYGVNISGFSDPKIRQQLIAQGAKNQQQENFLKSLGLGGQDNSLKNNTLEGEDVQISSDILKNITPQQLAAISVKNPQIASLLENQRQFQLRQDEKKPEAIREKKISESLAGADVKYNQNLEETSKQHALKEETISRLKDLNKKKVTGKPYEKFLERVGLINLTSEGRREFSANVKNLITDIRSILGGQFSNFEFQTILNAYPSADFSPEANDAIINNLEYFQDIKNKEVEVARKLKKENKGKIPEDFQSKVNEEVSQYAQSKSKEIKQNTRKIINEQHAIPKGFTLMYDPEGNELSVPDRDIKKYTDLGATLP
jgi:hypothetical protein